MGHWLGVLMLRLLCQIQEVLWGLVWVAIPLGTLSLFVVMFSFIFTLLFRFLQGE